MTARSCGYIPKAWEQLSVCYQWNSLYVSEHQKAFPSLFPTDHPQRADGDFAEICVAQQIKMNQREFHWLWVVPTVISELLEELLSAYPPGYSYSRSKNTQILESPWKAAASRLCHHWSQWLPPRAHREQWQTSAYNFRESNPKLLQCQAKLINYFCLNI